MRQRIHNAAKVAMGLLFGAGAGIFLIGTIMFFVPIAMGNEEVPELPLRTWSLAMCFGVASALCLVVVQCTDE